MHHGVSSSQLLYSIFSDLAEANEGVGMEELIASIPSAIEDVLPYAIYNVRTSPIQLSDVAIRFRELKNERKQKYIRDELRDLGTDPEVVLIDAKTVMNQWSDSGSPGGMALGFGTSVSTQIPFYSEMMRSGKSFVNVAFLDAMKKAKSVIGQRSLLVIDDSDSSSYESEKPDTASLISDLPESLQKIKSKLTEHQFLSLQDMVDVTHVMKNMIVDEKELNAVLSLLKTDIETRNKKSNIDCIGNLYENQNLLPKGRRLVKPIKRDRQIRIKEMIQAIILNEYEIERRKLSQDFLFKKIDYETYQNSVKTLAKTTDLIWKK